MASPPSAPVAVVDWGRTRYRAALAVQETRLAARIAGQAPDTLVLTEHEPVYTVGLRAGAAQNLLLEAAELARRGIDLVETSRGGDITYHGPGQLIAYPIVSLEPRRDLHAYLRFLEDVLIATTAAFGLPAARRPGKTGLWIGSRKVAAIGIAVRRWVAYHGVSLNVNPDLDAFGGIIPCGIPAAEGSVTSLARELPQPPSLAAAQAALIHAFQSAWPTFLAGESMDK
jgi:lipoyl(octanoyl) transferase